MSVRSLLMTPARVTSAEMRHFAALVLTPFLAGRRGVEGD